MRTLPMQTIRTTELRLIWTRLAFVALAALLITADFSKALLELVRRWSEQEEFSHGFLIPIVTIWLLWTRRTELRESMGRPSWLGPILILIALIMHTLAELGALFIILSQIAFVIALAGLVLTLGGHQLLRVCLIPIVFLLFAIPPPDFIEAALTIQLQLISSELGTFIIRTLGIPVYLDGNIIDLGHYKIQVAEACSGLQYLYPLLGLSFLAAYLFRAPFWQRAIVFLSAVPISIGMNSFRIGLVGVMVDRWGPAMADRTLHMFEGWVIFLACAALLFAEMYLLSFISGEPFWGAFRLAGRPARIPSEQRGILHARPLVASLALICIGTIVVFRISDRAEVIPQRTSFVEFPVRVGPWQGRRSELDADTLKVLRLDDYILSDYVQSEGDAVNLYIAYYASQRTGESPHSPIVCIPGGGWTITNLQQISYAAPKGRNPDQSSRYWEGDGQGAGILLVRRARPRCRKRVLGEGSICSLMRL